MLRQGFNATTIDQVCQSAEITKGGFFHYFKNKEDLGLATLEYYWQSRQMSFAASEWHAIHDPMERLLGFLDTVAAVFMADDPHLGCLAGMFSLELSEVVPNLRDYNQKLFAEWAESIKPVLDEAQHAYRPAPAVDSTLLADHIITVLEGALVLARVRQNCLVIEQQIAMLKHYIAILYTR